MCTSVRKHVIGQIGAPGTLEIYKNYGSFFVTYVALTGSNFPKTGNYRTIEEANSVFDQIVEEHNWFGPTDHYVPVTNPPPVS